MLEPLPSSCGCNKPADAWGAGGWHFRWSSTAMCWRRGLWIRRGHKDGEDIEVLVCIGGCQVRTRRPGEKAVHEPEEPACIYAARPFAYEPCEAYLAACARAVSDEKTKKRDRLREELSPAEQEAEERLAWQRQRRDQRREAGRPSGPVAETLKGVFR